MENLRKIRKSKGIKQLEVANFLNITEASYSRYESGKVKITPETLGKLADFFNVSTEYLLGRISKPFSTEELEFLSNTSKSDEDLLKQYKFNYGGKEITQEEIKLLIELIRKMQK